MFNTTPLTPLVRALLIALGVTFVLVAILENFVGVPVTLLLALHPSTVSAWTPVQLVAHWLILPPNRDAVLQIVLAPLFLWLFLSPVEASFGRGRTVLLAVVSVLASALAAFLVGLALPRFSAPIVGPDAITSGAVAAYVTILPPNALMQFGRLTFPPRFLLFFSIALSIVYFLTDRNAAGFAASLAALGAGLLFTRKVILGAPRRAPSTRKGSSARLRLVKKDDDDDDEPKRWLN